MDEHTCMDEQQVANGTKLLQEQEHNKDIKSKENTSSKRLQSLMRAFNPLTHILP